MNFFGKRLLFVVAHPDDESFAASGTIKKNLDEGGENFLICATYGEKGKSHLKKNLSKAALKKMRKKELEKVSKFLGVKKLLGFSMKDGGLKESASILKAKINKAVREIRPDFIFSFGSDGISGHLDHITVGKSAKYAARKMDIPFIAFSASPYLSKQRMLARRKFGVYSNSAKRQEYNLKIKIDPAAKMKAVSFHKSQFGADSPFKGFSEKQRKMIIGHEYFYVQPDARRRPKAVH